MPNQRGGPRPPSCRRKAPSLGRVHPGSVGQMLQCHAVSGEVGEHLREQRLIETAPPSVAT